MGISELVFNKKALKSKKDILDVLRKLELYWLIDSECEGACIEIEKNTVIWHSGLYLTGDWNFGIFLNGDFRGNWINGIWGDGLFDDDIYQKIEISKNVFTLKRK
ncbi:MAG: hypothetical protein EB079_02615 [Verrucomicrobia bacterium]|jgi:hypothetical protein|nr:hypothetical protein [Verrucomicrobiota bacterium]